MPRFARIDDERPRCVPPLPPSARERAVIQEVRELITDADVAKVMLRLRQALDAKISSRAPRGVTAEGKREANNYMIVDDWATRLAAAKLLLAYRFGNPVSTLDVQAAIDAPGSSEREPVTRDEMIGQLRASGTNLPDIVGAWLGGLKQVAESGPIPADLKETAQRVEQLAIVDV